MEKTGKTHSRLTGSNLGVGGVKRWRGCRERASRGGWCSFAFSPRFVAMVLVVVLVAVGVTMRSFVVMVLSVLNIEW
jgi:hypothetical protein